MRGRCMVENGIAFTLGSCLCFMAFVGWVSYRRTRGEVATKEGYFLAGRGLTGPVIAGSLLLTNLSAEQLIGLNGSAYGFNMTAMAWEVTAGAAIIVMALVFLPRYLNGAFSTLPQFLEDRFDAGVRRLTVVLFLLGYALVTIPSILYSGALAVMKLFDVQTLTGLSFSASLVLTILTIGVVGGLYAVFGGLRAVAISDTLNDVGLLCVGALVPIAGLAMLGDGRVVEGWRIVASVDVEKLNAIGSATDPVPFGTLFTGMILANLFYWGTNQYVIQRTLGAASLAEGQKGVLLSGFFKLLVPFFMMLPGVIAFHLYGDGLAHMDLAYPTLVADVLPAYLGGLFLAVLLGAVFSSFNSLVNSAATLFCLDIYQPLSRRHVSDLELIRVGKGISVLVAVLSFAAAPFLQYAPDGLWQVIRVFTGFYNVPVIALVLVAMFFPGVPPNAAKTAVCFHVIAYACTQFVFTVTLNFVHVYAILFALEMAIMLGWRAFSSGNHTSGARSEARRALVDMTPWRHAGGVAVVLASAIVAVYLFFSPIGVVGGFTASFWLALLGVIGTASLGVVYSDRLWRARHQSRNAAR